MSGDVVVTPNAHPPAMTRRLRDEFEFAGCRHLIGLRERQSLAHRTPVTMFADILRGHRAHRNPDALESIARTEQRLEPLLDYYHFVCTFRRIPNVRGIPGIRYTVSVATSASVQ